MLGAKLMLEGIWMKPGVYNTEEMDPDPFMRKLVVMAYLGTKKLVPVLPHEY
jgi:saccharopine dehydrogenase (NAD+, L-lysine-forming)